MEVQRSHHSNLSKNQCHALKELSGLEDVVIHKADKGGIHINVGHLILLRSLDRNWKDWLWKDYI